MIIIGHEYKRETGDRSQGGGKERVRRGVRKHIYVYI
jgi:hypothetical protein